MGFLLTAIAIVLGCICTFMLDALDCPSWVASTIGGVVAFVVAFILQYTWYRKH